MDINLFLASTAGLALKATLLWAFLDFATGSYAALKDGTFAPDAIGAFIRKHLAGRVAPIATLLIAGYLSGDMALQAAAAAGALAYTAETAASVYGNFLPPKASVEAEASPAELVNPVPQD